MAKKGCGHYLLIVFRVLQFIFSIVALACAVYITRTMFSMGESAHSIREAIEGLDKNDETMGDAISLLQDSLAPVLKNFEEKPTRAIIILVVAIWSSALIIYLFFAHRSAQKANRDLARNSRKIRVLLSFVTLLLWITALVCSVLLVIQYGVFAITIGPETKIAVTVAKQALLAALSTIDVIGDTLDVVSGIMTVGFMAIVLVVASSICGIVELVSCFVACCVSGKAKPQEEYQQREMMLEKNQVQYSATPVQQYSPSPVQQYSATPVQQYSPSPVQQYSTSPVQQYSATPVHQYNAIPVYQYGASPVYQ